VVELKSFILTFNRKSLTLNGCNFSYFAGGGFKVIRNQNIDPLNTVTVLPEKILFFGKKFCGGVSIRITEGPIDQGGYEYKGGNDDIWGGVLTTQTAESDPLAGVFFP